MAGFNPIIYGRFWVITEGLLTGNRKIFWGLSLKAVQNDTIYKNPADVFLSLTDEQYAALKRR